MNLPPECLAELESARSALTAQLTTNERKHCGFKRGDNAKTEDGEYDEMAILRNTHYECFSCGSAWRDEPHIRTALDKSSFYVPARKATNPSVIGFNVSQWINTRLPWGVMMIDYLKALKVKRDFKNEVRLKQWWQKYAGTTWNPNLARILRIQTQEKYDVKSDWPEEWRNHRCFIVDCQHELQHFWGSIWAVSKTGKSRQLWRGLIRGFDKIVELQKEWSVLDQFVFLDAGYMEEELTEECAKHGHWITWNGGRDWACWTLLVGSPQKDFSHKDDKNTKNRHPISDPFYNWPKVRVDQHRVSVEKYYFSALQMGDMFARYRDGNGPETLFLPETDSGKLSWTDQINSCSKIHLVNNRTGEATEIWKAATQNTPTHYYDCCRMLMCVLCLWGISGHQEFTPPTEVAATVQ